VGLPETFSRVLRGGSWINNNDNARASYRNNNAPDNRNNNIGFRVCCVSHIDPLILHLCSGLIPHELCLTFGWHNIRNCAPIKVCEPRRRID
jgi:hypothetical protein